MGFDAARTGRDVIVFWFSEIKTTAGGQALGDRGRFVVFPKEMGG
jgi:hypothetical protein